MEPFLVFAHGSISTAWYLTAMLLQNRAVVFMSGSLVLTHVATALFLLAHVARAGARAAMHRGADALDALGTKDSRRQAQEHRRSAAALPLLTENLLHALIGVAVLALPALACYLSNVFAAMTLAPACAPYVPLDANGTLAICPPTQVTRALAYAMWAGEERALVVIVITLLVATVCLHVGDILYAGVRLAQWRRPASVGAGDTVHL